MENPKCNPSDNSEIINKLLSQIVPGELIDENVYRFAREALKAIQLYASKNHDYGNSFEDGMDLIGDAYGVGRIYDKAKRLANLVKNPENIKVGESMMETSIDLACYSIMYNSYKNKKYV